MKKLLAVSILSVVSFFIWSNMAISGEWAQFGHDQCNTNMAHILGPENGLNTTTTLISPTGSEVGVLVDDDGDFYVSSYDPEIYVYDPNGNHVGTYTFPASVSYGPRAVPLVDYKRRKNLIYTGTESGGFYVIGVDKSNPSSYSLLLAASDTSIGTIETSPVMAKDGTVYVAEQWGDIHRFQYSGGTLTLLNTYSTGEVITGAIALANVNCLSSPGDEVVVATQSGNLYVLSHDLSTVLYTNTYGNSNNDQYYGGVTIVRRRGIGYDPIAVLGVTGASSSSTYSGNIRAINLCSPSSTAVEWELTPSNTTMGTHEVQGSIALLWEDSGNFYAVASSTDGYLYGFDLQTGSEVWSYGMSSSGSPVAGHAAPVVDSNNVVFAVDGNSYIYAIDGNTGTSVFTDSSVAIGGGSDIGKLAISTGRRMALGTGSTAYFFEE